MNRPNDEYTRPSGISDETVEALDLFTRALETIEVARGHLLQFHRLTGTGDTQLRESVSALHSAGHGELAHLVEHELVGRNVIEGRWTFQIIEEYDDTYMSTWRHLEAQARDELVGGRRHLKEAEMKEDNRTHGHRRHTAAPPGAT